MKPYRFILTGLGNIGRTFLEMLLIQEQLLVERYGLALQAVGVADSSGAIYAPEGLDVAAVVAQKKRGGAWLNWPGRGSGAATAWPWSNRSKLIFYWKPHRRT
ncbi:MAG: hypothetical protein HC875_09235 [Anaerolineales bacterium]|nr:hypothetical protein [Anaerolineales bacterium]